ncbi:hypothetical protein F442_09687 [Phytophthora nicotianae P10297]|uniref:Annexin n=1 Tax=Phytophthora nicotianae P10297 TaxID=1317064 RepID=W2Z8A4_PHYNI|nr:hypothetical protein F442_09687 [Phytophthora nicotianae P10297]
MAPVPKSNMTTTFRNLVDIIQTPKSVEVLQTRRPQALVPVHSSIRRPTTSHSAFKIKTLNLYPPSAFDNGINISAHIDAVVEKIRATCDGVGIDDKALVRLIVPLSPNDRALVSLRYKELHGQTLHELIKSETSGNFGYLVQLITFPLHQAEAYILFYAMKGAGTTDHLLYSILMGRSSKEIGLLKKTYFDMYVTDLSATISNEISGTFLAVIMKALQVSSQ